MDELHVYVLGKTQNTQHSVIILILLAWSMITNCPPKNAAYIVATRTVPILDLCPGCVPVGTPVTVLSRIIDQPGACTASESCPVHVRLAS